jgi:hypothetical protein
MKKKIYNRLFEGKGPKIDKACLLSLPKFNQALLSGLPEEFCLILGTAKGSEQTLDEYYTFNDIILRIANNFKIPIIFKSHNLSAKHDETWLRKQSHINNPYIQINDIEFNRQLIDRASVIITGYSTLVYYAILKEKPLIIVNTSLSSPIGNELSGSPLIQIPYNINKFNIEIEDLKINAKNALKWFKDNYYMSHGADYIVSYAY